MIEQTRLAEPPSRPAASVPPSLAPLCPPAPRRGLSRLRLGQWYGIGGLLLGLLLLAALTQSGLALYNNSKARDILINRVDPAALQQFQLTSALGAQDTAIRDFVSTREGRFLAAYRTGAAAERRAAGTMRGLLAGVSSVASSGAELDRLTAATDAWRTRFAEPLAAGGRLPPASDRLGQQLFAEVRAANNALQRGLTGLHAEYDQRLRDRVRVLYASMAFTALMLLVVGVLLVILIRRTVLRPVSTLTDQVRAVAQGDFAHPLQISGPAELAELAGIVDSMRHRIIEEWRSSSEARALVDEQAAELRRSNAELEQFAYVASHDLQEPLRKVASFCQMIERKYGDRLDERGRQYIDFAVDGAKRMQALINDLLSFSRVGRFTRTEESVELGVVLDRALDNLGHTIEETGAEVTADELPELPGDRTLLTQLLQNLIGNAIKFHGAEPPRVRITARRSGPMWEFGCADNGIGIDAKYADRIFLIFQRLHPQDEYTGTGIGLAMCKKIVEYHGGRIWLDLEHPGAGTIFRWTLPATLDEESEGTDDE